jgi:tripartite-type tricarboxylate transporter receptor subunit TctC
MLLRLLVLLSVAMGGLNVAYAQPAPATSSGQAFPSKPMRLILPFPPGGPTDLLGRALAQKLGEQMGQTMVADNRPGAGGNLGIELAAKSPPDGHSLVLVSSVISIAPSLYAKLNYEQKDLTPVSLVAEMRNVVLIHPSVPVKNFKEFLQLVAKYPGKLNYGSGGVGTTTHITPELIMNLVNGKMNHVPYKGSGLALIGLIGGQVDVLIMTVSASYNQVRAGKVRALAIVAPDRASQLPDVPTVKELGHENFIVRLWYGVLVPSATPAPLVSRLNSEVLKALSSADLKERLVGGGIEPLTSTPQEFASFIQKETVRYARVIKSAGIKAE